MNRTTDAHSLAEDAERATYYTSPHAPASRAAESGALLDALMAWNNASLAVELIRFEDIAGYTEVQCVDRDVRYLEARRAEQTADVEFGTARRRYLRERRLAVQGKTAETS